MFRSIYLHNWRQIHDVQIEFHPRLTMLTGANGSGKTTILHLLNRHWGWDIQYVSSPEWKGKKGRRYLAGFWSEKEIDSGLDVVNQHEIGRIEYRDHPPGTLSVPEKVAETFQVKISPQPVLKGVYVPSHRPLYVHQKVEQIPTEVDAREQLYDSFLRETRNRWAVNARVKSPSYILKQSLISLATFGYGNEAVRPNPAAIEAFEGFVKILSIILPPSIGFQKLAIQMPDVLLETSTGNFPLDAASGGISTLIDIAWQIHLYSLLEDEFVVAIDEPEAHLHPELQQSFLPRLLEAFPNAQFIVATHNPFVVGSARESNVYVLKFEEDKKVTGFLLDQVNKAGTANEILRDALGMESTTAVWVNSKLEEIVNEFLTQPLNEETLRLLRSALQELGLTRFLPEAIDQIRDTENE